MGITVRKAKPEDLKSIQDLNHQLFLFDHDRDPQLNTQWPYEREGKDYFSKMIAGEIGVCFVAESDNKVIGYLAGSIKTEVTSYRPIRRTELENMFVVKELRGQGVGTILAKEFIGWSKKQGVEHVFVSAYAGNKDAIKFYEKAGFLPRAIELELNSTN